MGGELSENQSSVERSTAAFAGASGRLFDMLLAEEEPPAILDSMARILGETLDVDRVLVFDVSFSRNDAHTVAQWLNPEQPTIAPSAPTYSLDAFRSSMSAVRESRRFLESHVDEVNSFLQADGAAGLLHGVLEIQSLLWYPFSFRPDALFVLAFNQVTRRRHWRLSEIAFIDMAARHVSMALIKLQLVEQRKRAEQAMLNAQKLESLGVLAGGIAHDFNNLLVGILVNAELVLHELPPDSPLRAFVSKISLAGQRAADLAREMLAYSGSGHFVVEPIELGAIVHETATLLQSSIAKTTRLYYELDAKLPYVKGDVTQMRQIIMNLIVNASEALEGHDGRVLVRSGITSVSDHLSSALMPPAELPSGRYVFLEVTDDGQGMDAATQARIFDPFFTTKRTGRGLGLAAVLGIVKSHDGAIQVRSRPGEGTTFRVLFPAVERTERTAPRTPPEVMSGERLGKTVLVVDDEPDICDAFEQVLRRFGYSPIIAVGGTEALEIFESRPDEIDCVLLDLTMPAPSGEEVLRELRAIRPDLPIILMSGYGRDDAERSVGPAEPNGFLQKPFSFDALLQVLRRILGHAEEG